MRNWMLFNHFQSKVLVYYSNAVQINFVKFFLTKFSLLTSKQVGVTVTHKIVFRRHLIRIYARTPPVQRFSLSRQMAGYFLSSCHGYSEIIFHSSFIHSFIHSFSVIA
jgi:hypothetical protein